MPAPQAPSDCTLVLRSAPDAWALLQGHVSPQQAFARGQLSVKGSLSALLQLRPFLAELKGRLKELRRWLPDSASKACMACDASFTMMRPLKRSMELGARRLLT